MARRKTRKERLNSRRKRHRILALVVALTAALVGGGVAFASVSQTNELWTCVDASGIARHGFTAYERPCLSGEQPVGFSVHGATATTTTRPVTTTSGAPTTTTGVPTGGTIVPAGPACPRSTSSSTYEGLTLTVAQAAQAAYLGGFHAVNDIQAIIGIGRAESSLCVRVWHWHPEFGAGQADVGWLQISTHFWPQFPQSQTLDPVGAVKAAVIVKGSGGFGQWDTYPTGQEPTAATVCAVVPATGC